MPLPRPLVCAFLCAVARIALAGQPAVPAVSPPTKEGLYAEITTPRGSVLCELFPDRTPLTVASFVGLAEGTLGPKPRRPYFDGLTFHRVAPGFVVQGGDPTGTGDGGPGYTIADECQPGLRHDATGVLSMANKGPDTNGSQFFLTLRETNRLNYLHTVFGRVTSGLDVLPRIKQGDQMQVKIHRVGAAAKAFRADEAAFAGLMAQAKKYTDVPTAKREPGPEAHFDDPDGLVPADPPRAKNFNFKLANFERATGLRIVARLRKNSPPAAEDAEPGAFMRALAAKLGTAQRGALAVYFADEDDWRVWIGDESTAQFVGRAGTAREFTDSGLMHEVKEAFLKTARDTGNAEFAQQQTKAAEEKSAPPVPAQKLKLHTDAILDGLIARLEPKR